MKRILVYRQIVDSSRNIATRMISKIILEIIETRSSILNEEEEETCGNELLWKEENP